MTPAHVIAVRDAPRNSREAVRRAWRVGMAAHAPDAKNVGMWSTEFAERVALERNMLMRAMPLIPSEGSGIKLTVRQPGGDTGVHIQVRTVDSLGATPRSCIELLGIRSLLFGAAWKVLDTAMDIVLARAGVRPDRGRDYSIDRKVRDSPSATTSFLDQETWREVCRIYMATAELRHSLVHRHVHTDSTQALVGRGRDGAELDPVSVDVQEGVIRVALRLCEAADQSPSIDSRTSNDLIAALARLPWTVGKSTGIAMPEVIHEVLVILGPEPDGAYTLDIPALRENQNLVDKPYADVAVEFDGSGGVTAYGRLEDAPDEAVHLRADPKSWPSWLR